MPPISETHTTHQHHWKSVEDSHTALPICKQPRTTGSQRYMHHSMEQRTLDGSSPTLSLTHSRTNSFANNLDQQT